MITKFVQAIKTKSLWPFHSKANNVIFQRLALLGFFCLFLSCGDEMQEEGVNPSLYVGGENLTTFVGGENAFGTQAMNLSREDSRLFVAGNSLFRSNWITAPASVTSLDGLGPLFNAISCGSCHFKDGRAAPPDEFAVQKPGLLFRLSTDGTNAFGEPNPHRVYGGQLQDRSLQSAEPEAKVNIQYEIIQGQYPDGSLYSLRKPIYSFSDWTYGDIESNFDFSPRIATQLVGLGLLEAISEEDILANEDVADSNNDGISGKANRVYDAELQNLVLGRFGWKANQPNIRQQNAGAFGGDMGLTTSLFPKDDWTDTQEEKYPDIINGGEPEVSDEQLYRISLYVQTLSVPAARNIDSQEYVLGKKLFDQVNCNGCHKARFTTGTGNELSVLDDQVISPYTDLLLHDMGSDLADGRPDFLANGREWRTPPLWGVGLIPSVNDHSRYLHDGRARNIEEAILWHAGEAKQSIDRFKMLSEEERQALIFFVNSI